MAAPIATLFAPKVCNVELDVRRMIRTALSYDNVFAHVMDLMQLHYGNHPTKTRGDVFEVLCREYLLATGQFRHVWLLQDVPDDVRQRLNLGTRDMGMDLVCERWAPLDDNKKKKKMKNGNTSVSRKRSRPTEAGPEGDAKENEEEEEEEAKDNEHDHMAVDLVEEQKMNPPAAAAAAAAATPNADLPPLYCAVQAKYRKRSDKAAMRLNVRASSSASMQTASSRVHSMGAPRQITIRPNQLNWNTLSTFYALCARTGPWASLIVMTTCDSVRRQGKKTSSDKTYAYKGWCSVPRTLWLRMAGSSGYSLMGNSLGSPTPAAAALARKPVMVDEGEDEDDDRPLVAPIAIPTTQLGQAELRDRRSAFFGGGEKN